MRKRTLNCVDLFAGAGGFSLAAQNLGLDIRMAIEFDRHAASTYRANICKSGGDVVLLNEDITELDPHAEISKAFPDGLHCDLLLGGPPCQGYSTHRINDSGVDDERNTLVQTYFDWVDALSPSAFVMENVPGMLWERHRDYVEAFYKRAKESGYHLFDPVILDARDFGVPQRRKRVFILGLRDGSQTSSLTWPPIPTHADPRKRTPNDGLLDWADCSSAFVDLPENDVNDVHMRHGPELVEAFKNTPVNGGSRRESGRVLDCHKDHDGHKDVYGRIDPAQPAPTMTTACINPSKGRFVHPTLPHGITVRQAARIQSFPDEFVFQGGLMAAGKQVGNAVPVKLGEVVISSIIPMFVEDSTKLAA